MPYCYHIVGNKASFFADMPERSFRGTAHRFAGTIMPQASDLVDQWGTPYFFHQLSASEMEVHCAGPDKMMWTSDDLVVK
jgi:hypothetical protein